MAYFSNVSNEKVFVTRKLLEQNAFNPSLVVRSAGIDANTANVIDITSWTYKKREGIVIPRSITHSKFEEQTGVPLSHRSLHLRIAKLNTPLDDSAFDYGLALAIEEPVHSMSVSPLPPFGHEGAFRRSGGLQEDNPD
jgi:hypothetical protein